MRSNRVELNIASGSVVVLFLSCGFQTNLSYLTQSYLRLENKYLFITIVTMVDFFYRRSDCCYHRR